MIEWDESLKKALSFEKRKAYLSAQLDLFSDSQLIFISSKKLLDTQAAMFSGSRSCLGHAL